MNPTTEAKPFNKRAFYSIVLFISGMLLPVSGIMNHQLQFEPFTTARHFWMAVHNMSATLFSLAAIMHITTNWRALVHYMKQMRGISLSKEALAAVVLVIGIVALVASHAFHVR